jgi:hypothetical protein
MLISYVKEFHKLHEEYLVSLNRSSKNDNNKEDESEPWMLDKGEDNPAPEEIEEMLMYEDVLSIEDFHIK